MKRNGNASINRTYNPQNTQPPIPLDVDEVDAVLERFIRQKYDQQSYTSGNARPPAKKNDTGSTRSSDDQPPPLPPKPGKRFGFGLRSASSVLPVHRNGPTSPPRSPHTGNGWGDEPIRVNKQSRVFGASVGGNNDNMDTKLAQLRDMGFLDEKRNVNVLKGLGGNLERTIESLIRLGEGGLTSRSKTPLQARNVVVGHPVPAASPNASVTNGISFPNKEPVSQTDTGSTGQQSSQNSAPPQQMMDTRTLSPSNPYQQQSQSQAQSYNPFDPSHDQRMRMASMDQAFNVMQVSQQPLFPNATGGYPNQPPPMQDARLQTMTPPVPQMPHQYNQTNPYIQQNQTTNESFNPFHQNAQQSTPTSPNSFPPSFQQQSIPVSYNPFLQTSAMSSPRVPSSTDSPQTYSPHTQQGGFQQIPPQPQYSNYQQTPQAISIQQPSFADPLRYGTPAQLHMQHNLNPYQQQPLQPQPTGRIDKSSILALYNYPQLAPPPLSTDLSSQSTSTPSGQLSTNPTENKAPQRSVTMPIQPSMGSKNPFQSALSTQPIPNINPPGIGRHASQESVDIGGFQNGRHSPDAFANLSARFVR